MAPRGLARVGRLGGVHDASGVAGPTCGVAQGRARDGRGRFTPFGVASVGICALWRLLLGLLVCCPSVSISQACTTVCAPAPDTATTQVPAGWDEIPVSIADLGGTEVSASFTHPLPQRMPRPVGWGAAPGTWAPSACSEPASTGLTFLSPPPVRCPSPLLSPCFHCPDLAPLALL